MKVNKEESVMLFLTRQEAEWLKSAMQNPLHGETPDEEYSENAYFRKCFFDVLKEVLE